MSVRFFDRYRDLLLAHSNRGQEVRAGHPPLLSKETLNSAVRLTAVLLICGILGLAAHQKTGQKAVRIFLQENAPSLIAWEKTLGTAGWKEWRSPDEALRGHLRLPYSRDTDVIFVDRKNALFYLIRPETRILYHRGIAPPQGVVAAEWESLGSSWVGFQGLLRVSGEFAPLETLKTHSKRARFRPQDPKSIEY